MEVNSFQIVLIDVSHIMACTCLKGGTKCSVIIEWKNTIYSAPAVKGLRYQYTANVPAFSDIDGSGPREKTYIL